VAESFLAAGLVERYHEFIGPEPLGPGSVAGPLSAPPNDSGRWRLASMTTTGIDMYRTWERIAAFDELLVAA